MQISYLASDTDDPDLIVAVAEVDTAHGCAFVVYGSGRSKSDADTDLAANADLVQTALASGPLVT